MIRVRLFLNNGAHCWLSVMTLRRRAVGATAPPMPTHKTSGGRSSNVGKPPHHVARSGLGTQAKVQAKMTQFFAGLKDRTGEAQPRCRRTLHVLAAAHNAAADDSSELAPHVVLTRASV